MKKLILSALLLLCIQSSFSQKTAGTHREKAAANRKTTETKKIEALISNGIETAYHSSVLISAYDTVRKQAENGVFSGVVVSAEGHVLTVAHAIKPREIYQVRFPDGASHLAMGLGRMAVSSGGRDLDMAMIKILKPGKWPFAKMGSNAETRINQPALSISYPGSFDHHLPNVRFGRLINVDISSGYLVSSCKMEPGDSGGPLFDIQGRVIGLHSWIKESEEENYEVPIDLYKRYWAALNVAEDYKTLPVGDELEVVSPVRPIAAVQPLSELAALPVNAEKNVVSIQSRRAGKTVPILGTVLEYGTGRVKEVYIVSKSSEVADSIQVSLAGKDIPVSVISRDRENDLVLLKSKIKLPVPISLQADQPEVALTIHHLGHFMVSPLGAAAKKVGVLSTLYTDMPMRFSVGHFGANATFINQKITITDISRGSASSEVLKLQDQVTAINGVSISQPPEYGAELMKHLAGDSISVDVVRAGKAMHIKMYLPPYPGANHVASKFDGGRSARSDGFKKIFVQDAAIKAAECGSPVFDSEGVFRGINIARHSRTATIVMPADVISIFIRQAIKS